MTLWSKPQPQEDDNSTSTLTFTEVDPDHVNGDEPEDRIPGYAYDEDGWPIIPGPGTMSPIWK